MRLAVCTALAALAALCAASAHAHPLAPSLLELREHDGGRVSMVFRTPRIGTAGAALVPILPEGCRETESPRAWAQAASSCARRCG